MKVWRKTQLIHFDFILLIKKKNLILKPLPLRLTQYPWTWSLLVCYSETLPLENKLQLCIGCIKILAVG